FPSCVGAYSTPPNRCEPWRPGLTGQPPLETPMLVQRGCPGRRPFQHGVAQVPQGGRGDLATGGRARGPRGRAGAGTSLRLRMVLTSPDAPSLQHVVEHTIELG